MYTATGIYEGRKRKGERKRATQLPTVRYLLTSGGQQKNCKKKQKEKYNTLLNR